jgi:hypothetical protein
MVFWKLSWLSKFDFLVSSKLLAPVQMSTLFAPDLRLGQLPCPCLSPFGAE